MAVIVPMALMITAALFYASLASSLLIGALSARPARSAWRLRQDRS